MGLPRVLARTRRMTPAMNKAGGKCERKGWNVTAPVMNLSVQDESEDDGKMPELGLPCPLAHNTSDSQNL
jgi:hypothetical protein